jgi:hypothetical protein
MARLKKFYLSCKYMHSQDCAIPNYVIKVGGIKLDHHLVTYILDIQEKLPRRFYWKMHSCYFVEANIQI